MQKDSGIFWRFWIPRKSWIFVKKWNAVLLAIYPWAHLSCEVNRFSKMLARTFNRYFQVWNSTPRDHLESQESGRSELWLWGPNATFWNRIKRPQSRINDQWMKKKNKMQLMREQQLLVLEGLIDLLGFGTSFRCHLHSVVKEKPYLLYRKEHSFDFHFLCGWFILFGIMEVRIVCLRHEFKLLLGQVFFGQTSHPNFRLLEIRRGENQARIRFRKKF